ncbi:hypothetical protein LMH87_006901 [Akanthomyces muscarius]|uniref:Uncharacterized protein n=1 Tax=Akanthomyces muscarius TaxID=2231603 RepID=A0A9W8UTH0_AKAMU|nr:hypothetical protein LMH87_006901 [Akanthomyces muscarius]KAJ4165263.1 hypothetical protein LMH87_006901 [Akanthomyces muscarius]
MFGYRNVISSCWLGPAVPLKLFALHAPALCSKGLRKWRSHCECWNHILTGDRVLLCPIRSAITSSLGLGATNYW